MLVLELLIFSHSSVSKAHPGDSKFLLHSLRPSSAVLENSVAVDVIPCVGGSGPRRVLQWAHSYSDAAWLMVYHTEEKDILSHQRMKNKSTKIGCEAKKDRKYPRQTHGRFKHACRSILKELERCFVFFFPWVNRWVICFSCYIFWT